MILFDEGGKKMAVNKSMFVVGIILVIVTAAIFLFVDQDLGITPTVLGIIGIVSIGASGYRPMKKK
tara:strand:- start:600 stop:797 length:198 start_codon:yes stop_codon:yes gene_type:complete